MAKYSAVSSITGDLFKEGWTRQSKAASQRAKTVIRPALMRDQRHMMRAASGSRAAMFKLVRGGGCRSSQQLHGQLEYLLGKADAILDSSGTFEQRGPLSSEGARDAAERWAQGWEGKTKAGQTSHMVMSFPVGTRASDVQAITERICEKFFDGKFDYIAAVHTDRAHPHAHIVVNRRGHDGELFTLRVGTEYSYEGFKDAMVEVAADYGVQLEGSSRLERGIVARAPSTADFRNGLRGDRPREGADLSYALREIARHSRTYHGLSQQVRAIAASDSGRAAPGELKDAPTLSELTQALERASVDLASGRSINPKTYGEVPMNQQTRFEDALRRLDATVQDAEDKIARADPAERPAMEAKLNEAMTRVADLNPYQGRSAELGREPSDDGIYSERNAGQAIAQLDQKGREGLDRALEGTGIDPAEVEARMRVSARNAALEQQWIADDVRSVANERGLDLKKQDDFEAALAEVDRAHDRVADYVSLQPAQERDGDAEGRGAADPTMDQMARRDETSEAEAAARGPREDDEAVEAAIRARDAAWSQDSGGAGAEIEATEIDPEKAGQDRFDTPHSYSNRFVITKRDDGQDFYRSYEDARPAISDSGDRLATKSADRATAMDMVELAAHRGWNSMSVKGPEDFRREMWIGGAAQGIKVTGYNPTERDLEEANRRMDLAKERSIERTDGQDQTKHGASLPTDTAKAAERDRQDERRAAEAAEGRVYTGNTPSSKADLTKMATPVNEADARRYREAVEERLTPDEIDRLKKGDVSALEGAGTRADQLTVAREYLKADGQSPAALRQVTQELQHEREQMQRGRDRGLDHG